MVRSTPWTLALIAVGAFACLASLAGRSFADDSEGIVRICDQVPGHGGHCQSQAASGCPNCPNGTCGYGNCGGMRKCGHVCQFINWFHPYGQCPHSPDYGYAPPGKRHTPHPQQVAYQKSFPNAWTGQPGAMGVGGPRPVSVYMPTDTTQLGYYYQAAPRWQARRGMVPPTPMPSQWHRELCQGQCGQQCPGQAVGGCPHCQSPAGEQIIHDGVMEAQPLPAEPKAAPAVDPQPMAPVPPAVPAAPLEKAESPNLQQIN